ncbi:MAG: PKD domain-containing protein [Promethearchaeota archaeon]
MTIIYFTSTTIIANGWVEFTFTRTIGNSPPTFKWDFGDGTTSTAQNPLHQYISSGNETLILTITDIDGDNDTETKIYFVIVEEPPSDAEILGYDTYLIIGIVSVTINVLILKKLKFKH